MQRERFGGFGDTVVPDTELITVIPSSLTVAVDDTKSKARRPLVVIAGPPAEEKALCKKIAKKHNFASLNSAMLRERAKTDVNRGEDGVRTFGERYTSFPNSS